MLSFKRYIRESIINVDFKDKRVLGDFKLPPKDHVEQWYKTNTAPSSVRGKHLEMNEAYNHYKEWSEKNNYHPFSKEEFFPAMSKLHPFGANIIDNKKHGYFNLQTISPANESILEAYTFYNDTKHPNQAPMSALDLKKWRDKDIMPTYQEHLTNMYILRHLQSKAQVPNDKIHYTNQLEICARKKKFIETHHPRFDQSKIKLHANMARWAAHSWLSTMGHTDFEPPTEKLQDPKVKDLPRTADGRIQFGVSKK